MIVIQNPFVFPVLVIIWSIDAWLWLAFIRLMLEKLSPNNQLAISLCKLVDPLVKASGRLMSKCFKKELPEWSLRLITIIALILSRYLLVSLIVSH
jgi:hypothetical protein